MLSLVLKANKKVKLLFNFLAEEALNKLNYHKLNKKTLRISWYNREQNNYRDHPEYNVFVKKISKTVTSQEFHELFSKYGNVVSARLVEDDEGENIGYGFVLYDSKQSADLAIREANNLDWKDKTLYAGPFVKNRPKKTPVFNNIYVKNIPMEFSEDYILNYFKTYGEIGSYIIKTPEPSSLEKLPEEKRNFILNHKYAFICFQKFETAAIVVNQVSYMKINDKDYNNLLNSIVEELKKQNVKEEDLYRCACYIIENCEDFKSNYTNQSKLADFIKAFVKHLADNDSYVVKDKTDRMECCQ